MIGFRGLRYIASYLTGLVMFLLLAWLQWQFTTWYIEAVFLWSVVGGFFSAGIMWLLTEPKKSVHRCHKEQKNEFQIITLRKEDWNEDTKRH